MTKISKKDPFELGFEWGTDRTIDDIERLEYWKDGRVIFDAWFASAARRYTAEYNIVGKENRDAFLEGAKVARKLLL